MNRTKDTRPGGFTLIELMVAVAIIALLVGIMLPTFAGVTSKAKTVATRGTFSALEKGLEFYKSERALGNSYPPSQGDKRGDPYEIANPIENSSSIVNSITGANLLVYGLTGADQLGTPGFQDIKSRPGNVPDVWYDDLGNDFNRREPSESSAYALDENRDPVRPRYPGNGATYVDDNTRADIRTLSQLFDDGVLIDDPEDMRFSRGVLVQPFFTDKWGLPILYYRAKRAGRTVVTNPGAAIGSYDVRDNAFLTGCNLPSFGREGVDFGPGKVANGYYSRIAQTELPGVDPGLTNGVHAILTDVAYEDTFERFILDPAVTVKNRAVRPDSYLLISAGPDSIYGTSDDVTNWERK